MSLSSVWPRCPEREREGERERSETACKTKRIPLLWGYVIIHEALNRVLQAVADNYIIILLFTWLIIMTLNMIKRQGGEGVTISKATGAVERMV